jgi:hypothetical protein
MKDNPGAGNISPPGFRISLGNYFSAFLSTLSLANFFVANTLPGITTSALFPACSAGEGSSSPG